LVSVIYFLEQLAVEEIFSLWKFYLFSLISCAFYFSFITHSFKFHSVCRVSKFRFFLCGFRVDETDFGFFVVSFWLVKFCGNVWLELDGREIMRRCLESDLKLNRLIWFFLRDQNPSSKFFVSLMKIEILCNIPSASHQFFEERC
jgi:hypothetical protein